MASRTLLVISAHVDDAARAAVAAGDWPRKDFLELAAALSADVIDLATVERQWTWRVLRRVAGTAAAQAWIAFTLRKRYDAIFTDGEHIGIPLALLLGTVRSRPRHVTIGHLLDTPAKRRIFRWSWARRGLDTALVHATRQAELAGTRLGLATDQVRLVPYQADPDFWSPRHTPGSEPLICSVGLEYRDYPTLLAAVEGLPIRVVVAAGSRWSQHDGGVSAEVPANVEITTLNYRALRDL